MLRLKTKLLSVTSLTLLMSVCGPHCFAQAVAVPGKISATPTSLDDVEKKMAKWLEGQQKALLKDLEKYVNQNSGTQNLEGLRIYRRHVMKELKRLGFQTQLVDGGETEVLSCKGKKIKFAKHLVAFRKHKKGGTKLLLNNHLDTVFGKDHFFQKYIPAPGKLSVAKGPGIMDAKGGTVVLLYALKALHKFKLLNQQNITVLFNTDEEMGSLGSRPLIEKLAKEHDFGLVFEGTSNNSMTHSRKGLGQVRLKVRGVAAHAGGAHNQGISAIHELSHKIIAIERLTNYSQATTVNTGIINGGEARNTVAPCADAYIDLRYVDNKRGQQVIDQINKIAKKNHITVGNLKTSTEVWARLHRPAKERLPKIDRLLSQVMGIAQNFGQNLNAKYSGGGTDGSIMQAVGLTTIDSLGIDGGGAHTPLEQADLTSLVPRAQTAAVFIKRLLKKKNQKQ